MELIKQRFFWIFPGWMLLCLGAGAAQNDWAEGTSRMNDGASRDYYNRAGYLKWNNFMGDWRDADNVAQGKKPFAQTDVVDTDKGRFIEWNVTPLVLQWLSGKHQNQGLFLSSIKGGGNIVFCSREHEEKSQRPELVLTTDKGNVTLQAQADTYLERSTYRSMGKRSELRVSGNPNHTLLRFDLSKVKESGKVQKAELRLFTTKQYGNCTIGVFRCSQGHEDPDRKPVPGLAAKYANDQGIEKDASVIFTANFESKDWDRKWTSVGVRERLTPLEADPKLKLDPLQGKALRVQIAKGTTTALNTLYKFKKQIGEEPEEIYFRYYLRLANDWNQTVQGGKMPGISGTYGKAGWGGRRSRGLKGWSARGSFSLTIPKDNPLGGLTPIGTYCYHADMPGTYGDVWVWQQGYRGYLETNRWYCVEQYLKMNTPGKKDGILRAWIDGRPAFEKTDIRFRQVPTLKIEQIWMNVYHGGTKPSPYDQHLFIDNVVISRKYVGPINNEKSGGE